MKIETGHGVKAERCPSTATRLDTQIKSSALKLTLFFRMLLEHCLSCWCGAVTNKAFINQVLL